MLYSLFILSVVACYIPCLHRLNFADNSYSCRVHIPCSFFQWSRAIFPVQCSFFQWSRAIFPVYIVSTSLFILSVVACIFPVHSFSGRVHIPCSFFQWSCALFPVYIVSTSLFILSVVACIFPVHSFSGRVLYSLFTSSQLRCSFFQWSRAIFPAHFFSGRVLYSLFPSSQLSGSFFQWWCSLFKTTKLIGNKCVGMAFVIIESIQTFS